MAEKLTVAVRVGADPEVFVKHTEMKKIVPVCGLVGGTKECPLEFHGMGNKVGDKNGIYAYQEDGCAFEFNIPAGHTYEHTALYLSNVWKASVNLLKEKKLSPVVEPFVQFDPDFLVDPRSRLIGCSPDLNAYGDTDAARIRPALNIASFGNTRFAGGHLHLSYDKIKVPTFVMARFLDVLVALPSLRFDKQGARRQYYGLPGLYREKSYGIEYRTLSNFWLKWVQNPEQTQNLYYLLGTFFDLGYLANSKPEILANAYKMIPWADVEGSINQENIKLAKEIYLYVDKTCKIPTRYGNALLKAAEK